MADFMVKGVRYRRQWPTYEEAASWEAELKKRIRLGIPYTELLEGTGDFITLGELADKTIIRYWEGTANESTMRIGYLQFDAAGRSGESNPFTNKLVRQAISHAIDREAIVASMLKGKSLPFLFVNKPFASP